MTEQSLNKSEIFLALALKQRTRQTAGDAILPAAESAPASNEETSPDSAREDFSVLLDYLDEAETRRFERVWADYQNKPETEKADWQTQVLQKIGTDEQLIDDAVHQSYISAALQKETPAVQKIVARGLPPAAQKSETFAFSKHETAPRHEKATALEKTVRRAFAKQFVALRDLPTPTAFDRLNGAQLARLIRLTGIREVALACLQIEAVELVAAFLRRFSAEDAQAIAAQLNGLPKMPDARMSFAENLVQTTMEDESQPSAILDLMGIHLVGVMLCTSPKERVAYTNQKLPLEAAAQLPEIVYEQSRNTLAVLQRRISQEIEQTAEMIFRAGNEKKPSGTRKKSLKS